MKARHVMAKRDKASRADCHSGNYPTNRQCYANTRNRGYVILGNLQMSVRTKKLIGSIAILILLVIYCMVALAIAEAYLAKAHWALQALYFAFTGILWVVPAMALVKWMVVDKSVSPRDG